MTFLKTLGWVEHELKEGRNDTVHDFVAYLAGQMIDMNKAKNAEIKGFLRWLEREIKADLDTLANKTAVRGYHEHDFNQFLAVLKRNRRRIAIDPSDRAIQEHLEKHFAQSVTVLRPLKERIRATDDLIDEIVYRLYGLTDDDVRIVKGQA